MQLLEIQSNLEIHLPRVEKDEATRKELKSLNLMANGRKMIKIGQAKWIGSPQHSQEKELCKKLDNSFMSVQLYCVHSTNICYGLCVHVFRHVSVSTPTSLLTGVVILFFTAVVVVLVTDMVVLLTKGDQKYNLACLQDRKVHTKFTCKLLIVIYYLLSKNSTSLHFSIL